MEQTKLYLKRNPRIKETVEQNTDTLKQENTSELYEKLKEANADSIQEYIKEATENAKSGMD
jgi:hypothetical protein